MCKNKTEGEKRKFLRKKFKKYKNVFAALLLVLHQENGLWLFQLVELEKK